MWRIERGPNRIGPRRWEWVCASTAHGLLMGYAWFHWQAERRLLRAEAELYGER